MRQCKTPAMQQFFTERGRPIKATMNANVNGISLGAREVLINNGIEFLFMNIYALRCVPELISFPAVIWNVDFYDGKGQLLCRDYRGVRKPMSKISESQQALLETEGHTVNRETVEKIEVCKQMEGDELSTRA